MKTHLGGFHIWDGHRQDSTGKRKKSFDKLSFSLVVESWLATEKTRVVDVAVMAVVRSKAGSPT